MVLILSIIFAFLIRTSVAEKDTLPVFIIDLDGVVGNVYFEPNPFTKITSAAFANIILNAIKNSEGIIIFVEETFSVEDLSSKDKLGTSYYHLHKNLMEYKAKYLPAVIDPYKTLRHIFQPQEFNVLYLESSPKLMLMEDLKYIYVFFQDGLNETRSEVLRRHDLIMREVYFMVRQLKNGPILAFYTGKINPVVVEKEEFVPIKPNPVPRDMGVMIVSSGALFRFSGVYATTAKRRALFYQLPMVAEETWTRRKMSTKMAYTDFEMLFNFSFGDKDWTLDNVALLEGGEEVGRTEMRVGAPWNHSYVCGEPLVLVNTRDGSSITISQYQIQPRTRRLQDSIPIQLRPQSHQYPSFPPEELSDYPTILSKSTRFGESVNCAPFFSSSILACLFVAFLLLGICFYGIVALYNCSSNNKYDDPHGKPLVLTES